MLAEFAAVARTRLTYHQPRIRMVVTGDVTDPAYWVRQVRTPVRFADGVRQLARNVTTALELGPDAVLAALRRQRRARAAARAAARRDRADRGRHRLGSRARRGLGEGLYGGGRTVDLPTYAFQRERYWPHQRAATESTWRYGVEWRPVPDAPRPA